MSEIFNIKDFQSDILVVEDLNDLRQMLFELTDEIGKTHKMVIVSSTIEEQSDNKARLAILYAMKESLEGKIEDERLIQKKEAIEVNNLNHKFKKAAKKMLTPETFNRILKESKKFSNEIKKTREFIKNKLE